MTTMSPQELRREIRLIERFLYSIPADLTESEQLMATTGVLARTLGTLRDVIDTLAAHLEKGHADDIPSR